MPSNEALCKLCPRECLINRKTQTGYCGMPDIMRIARIAPHFDEEPCISGSRGSGAVFLSGCPLKCAYCQNISISHQQTGRPYTPEALAESLKRLYDAGVQTISFVTPTHYTDNILQALTLYRPRLPIVWNTSGYESLATLTRLEGYVDVFLPDLKHFSPRISAQIAGAPDYFNVASKAIARMCHMTGEPRYDAQGIMTGGTLIRHLVLPGLTSDSIALLHFIKNDLPPHTPVSLMRQFTPIPGCSVKGLNRRVTEREYKRVVDCMLALDLPGYIQARSSVGAAFTPAFNTDEAYI